MSRNKNVITQSPKFKKAFEKVKKYVLKTRRENNEDISKRHINIISGFFEYQNIEYSLNDKRSLQYQLYELYVNGHPFFGKKFANSKPQQPIAKPLKQPKKYQKFSRYWKDPFFGSDQWQQLRQEVLKKYGKKCMKCGTKSKVMHVDHIKPRSKYPELKFDFTNLQVLCCDCNVKKSNIDETDYRNITINITINN